MPITKYLIVKKILPIYYISPMKLDISTLKHLKKRVP